MSAAVAGLVALLVLLGHERGGAGPQDAALAPGGAGAPAVTGGDPSADVDRATPRSFDQVGALLRALAVRHPGALSIGRIGESAEGRALWLATLSDAEGAPAAEKPALLVAAGFGEGAVASTEAALRAIEGLLTSAATDERVASLLRRATIYVAPCLDPDDRERRLVGDAPPAAGAAVEFDRNFPVGWHAWRAGGGAGPYPLSRPETRALADFLERHRHVALLQVLGEPGAPVDPAELPPGADRAAYRRLDGGAGGDVRAGFALDRDAAGPFHPGGGLLAFAQRRLGAHGFVTDTRLAGAPVLEAELEALGARATDAIRVLGRQLPYLLMDEPRVTRLRGSLWRVDVALRNVGALPTLSPLPGAEGGAGGRVRLELSGAAALAAAVRAEGADAFTATRGDPARLVLAPFAGGERRTVRFVIDAGEDGEPEDSPGEGAPVPLRLELSSERAGSTAIAVALR